jgi:hypothetical protein
MPQMPIISVNNGVRRSARIVDLQIQAVHKPLETVCDTGLRTVYVSVTLANEGTSEHQQCGAKCRN